MAEFQVRAASFYVNGLKMGEFGQTKYAVKGGGEPQFGDNSEPNGGGLGYTFGVVESTLSATTVHPYPAGTKIDLNAYVVSQQNVDVILSLINGHTHAVRMRVLSAETSSTHKSGEQTGDYQLAGFKPRII